MTMGEFLLRTVTECSIGLFGPLSRIDALVEATRLWLERIDVRERV